MFDEGHGYRRFTRHKVRHKRRRPRHAELPWKFHLGDRPLNVDEFDEDVPWDVIEGNSNGGNHSRKESPPMTLLQDEKESTVGKQVPVVTKCCNTGQNISSHLKRVCSPSVLTFQPIFYKANETHMWTHDSNEIEIFVDNPCSNDRYFLDPTVNSEDEFYLLVNGSLFAPYLTPSLLSPKEFCMETFYNDDNPAGVTLPLICFEEAVQTSSLTLIAYATGLIISVPFLLATAIVYTFITELRDTHGKALACHASCLAIAFSCLAATQLAGHAFPAAVCTIMAYVIQFSFVSCFFWLNVMCFDTLLNVRRYLTTKVTRRSMRKRFMWYCIYAIVLPLILLTITIIMELSPAVPSTYLKPNFGVKGCWFKTDQSALPYFYGPVAVILVANLAIFFFTSRAFASHYDKLKDMDPLELAHSELNNTENWVRLSEVLGAEFDVDRTTSPTNDSPISMKERLRRYSKIFRKCCMLCAIMGLSWVMEVVSWAAGAGSQAVSVWSIFDVINALQGVVIFAIFVLQQPVRSYVKFSKLCQECRRRNNDSEVNVVSERTSIDGGTPSGRRDYV